MDSVNKTLYIPLYGKALVSQKGIILNDKKAEEIWACEGFSLKRKSKSKWLAYYMAMRSRVFDDWVSEQLSLTPNATVLHLGCGLDGRVLRVSSKTLWFDVDFPSVIQERKHHYAENENYKMLAYDIIGDALLTEVPNGEKAVVVLEGVSMYIENSALKRLLKNLASKFKSLAVLVDCYTPFAVKMTKIKNPVNDVGVKNVYGIENPSVLESEEVEFLLEREITPLYLINELTGLEKFVFKNLYAGKTSKKLYKLYEYKKD